MKNMLNHTDLSVVPRRVYISKLLWQRGAGNPLVISNFLVVVPFGLQVEDSLQK